MKKWNLFKRPQISYHSILRDKEFASDSSDNGEGSSTTRPLTDDHEQDYYTSQALHRPRRSILTSPWCTILIALLSLLLGLLGGQFIRAEHNIDGYLPPYAHPTRNIHRTFTLNTTFTTPPSKANAQLWDALMPAGRGFVTHPRLTNSTPKALSGFHQLHCLYGLRIAYFAQRNFLDKQKAASIPGYTYEKNAYLDGMSEHELGLFHVEHCFEYLRQAVMCAADTNLEDTIVNEGGTETAPWGTERVCRDWEGVREWAGKWAAGDGSGIVG
ncbi:hypothetical protein BKA63DRAFT_139150 [Paraphoma chrysanthemicola]|nr:hypothetical protein BKA63DRAFT_139150 [Paraphoma chrysanthemicola]